MSECLNMETTNTAQSGRINQEDANNGEVSRLSVGQSFARPTRLWLNDSLGRMHRFFARIYDGGSLMSAAKHRLREADFCVVAECSIQFVRMPTGNISQTCCFGWLPDDAVLDHSTPVWRVLHRRGHVDSSVGWT